MNLDWVEYSKVYKLRNPPFLWVIFWGEWAGAVALQYIFLLIKEMERRRYKAIESQTEAFEVLDPLCMVDEATYSRNCSIC